MKIVLNTSPIIFLSKIDCLHLLVDCVDDIYVPQAVIEELRDYALPTFIIVHSLTAIGAAYVQGALGQLHQGELEAIVLAQELSADFVVLDDLLARRKAQRLEINVIGTLGLGDFQKLIYPLAGRIRMSHLGRIGLRSSLASIARIAILDSEIPLW